ncbi:MAG: hypothetical protein NT027_03160 [Proteobacteria bacterium]|nr:hypothetical protein [Pseudomonadota bacterium]
MSLLSKCILGTATVCAISACGIFGTKESGEKGKENSTELSGTWKLDCSKFDFLGLTGERETFVFSMIGDFERTLYVYDDVHCKTEVGKFETKGTYADLGQTSNAADGVKNINFTITEFDFTPGTDSATKILNLASYCGNTNWVAGEKVSLIGKSCLSGKISKGDTIFEVVKHQDNSLYFSDKLGIVGQRASLDRPSAVDASRAFDKK